MPKGDRADNNKGYVSDNCVPCCKTCNMAKFQMSQVDFAKWICRVFENWGHKEG